MVCNNPESAKVRRDPAFIRHFWRFPQTSQRRGYVAARYSGLTVASVDLPEINNWMRSFNIDSLLIVRENIGGCRQMKGVKDTSLKRCKIKWQCSNYKWQSFQEKYVYIPITSTNTIILIVTPSHKSILAVSTLYLP